MSVPAFLSHSPVQGGVLGGVGNACRSPSALPSKNPIQVVKRTQLKLPFRHAKSVTQREHEEYHSITEDSHNLLRGSLTTLAHSLMVTCDSGANVSIAISWSYRLALSQKLQPPIEDFCFEAARLRMRSSFAVLASAKVPGERKCRI